MTLSASALLASQVTPEQAEVALKDHCINAPVPIPADVLATNGTAESAIIFALAQLEGERSTTRAEYAAAGYRSTAPRTWLALHASEFYGLDVREADYATTNVTITNSSGNEYGPYEPFELRVLNKSVTPAVVYEITEAVTISPASLSEDFAVVVGARATVLGSAGSAASGEIDALETALNGVSVTNAQPATGQDEESRESINARIDARIGGFSIAGAPETKVESIARSGIDNESGCMRADGTRVTVTRTKLFRDDETGVATLYVADDDGPLTAPDLAVVEAEVQTFGEQTCHEIIVSNPILVTVQLSGTLTIRNSTLTDEEVYSIIDDALVLASRDVDIGGFAISGPPTNVLPRDYAEGAIVGAGEGKWRTISINLVSLDSPNPDLPMAQNELAVMARNAISIVRI